MVKDTNTFIEKSKLQFGELTFNYEKTKYVNNKTPIIITCNKHEDIKVIPGDFFRRRTHPCKKCQENYNMIQFKEKYYKIYGDKYQFLSTSFKTSTDRINMMCVKHGEFQITPSSLYYQGSGCNKCAIENSHIHQRTTVEKFISKAKSTHGDRYDYSQITEYKHNKSPVPIICNIHGLFSQKPLVHTRGGGCPVCAIENKVNYNKKEVKKHGHIPLNFYIIQFHNSQESFIKIGVTKHEEVHRRYYGFINKGGYEINILLVLRLNMWESYSLERYLIQKYKSSYKYIPISKFPGKTECLKEDVKNTIYDDIKMFFNDFLNKSPLVLEIIYHTYNINKF